VLIDEACAFEGSLVGFAERLGDIAREDLLRRVTFDPGRLEPDVT
jgi:hypothetical protein